MEEQARLRLGIFGQLAAGGDAGGFFRPAPAERSAARDARRSHRLGRAGRSEVAQSERMAALARTGRIACTAELEPRLTRAINDRLAGVLAVWNATPPGAALTLDWPDELTIRNGRLPAR